MKRTRRKFSSSFKTKVVLEALKERETLQELSSRFAIHSNQITTWKREFLSKSSVVFDTKSTKEEIEKEKDRLYMKIGQLEVENDFLKKVLDK